MKAVAFYVDRKTKALMAAEEEVNWSAVLRNTVRQKLEQIRNERLKENTP